MKMDKYPNIMKLVDKELAEQENLIEYYRNKQTEWEEERTNLTTKISHLESTISDLKADDEKYINEIKRMDAVNSDLKKVNEYLKGVSNND
jgi:septal ring factor EnvC (AmiA/AmiB activator)